MLFKTSKVIFKNIFRPSVWVGTYFSSFIVSREWLWISGVQNQIRQEYLLSIRVFHYLFRHFQHPFLQHLPLYVTNLHHICMDIYN